jgi:hypothetical protein
MRFSPVDLGMAAVLNRGLLVIFLLVLRNLPADGFIALPGNVTRVFLNIGSHIDPMPPPRGDMNTVTIAFEPVVGCRIKPREWLYVINAAVEADTSIATMGVYNSAQESSSLSVPAMGFEFARRVQRAVLVPVISIRTVLSSIPYEIDIWFMKTDMQGHDYNTMVAGGELLGRVHYIRVECWIKNIFSYKGVRNDFCRDLFPYMRTHGFELVHMHGNSGARAAVNNGRGVAGQAAALEWCEQTKNEPIQAGLLEADAYFKRVGTVLPLPLGRDWIFK